MIQVTVRIVQRSTRNSNSQMLVNEKNSMESNARLCTKTPVSYTHLDVYKRQVSEKPLEKASRNGCRGCRHPEQIQYYGSPAYFVQRKMCIRDSVRAVLI